MDKTTFLSFVAFSLTVGIVAVCGDDEVHLGDLEKNPELVGAFVDQLLVEAGEMRREMLLSTLKSLRTGGGNGLPNSAQILSRLKQAKLHASSSKIEQLSNKQQQPQQQQQQQQPTTVSSHKQLDEMRNLLSSADNSPRRQMLLRMIADAVKSRSGNCPTTLPPGFCRQPLTFFLWLKEVREQEKEREMYDVVKNMLVAMFASPQQHAPMAPTLTQQPNGQPTLASARARSAAAAKSAKVASL